MKYVFVGNRKFVLEAMLLSHLDISKVYVIDQSHLVKDIAFLPISSEITIINNKEAFFSDLVKTTYDIFISNGCPFILPPTILNDGRKYINIHPSYLPDLRGIDPVVGSILYHRDAGATCHLMNDNIDAGDIISQIKIPYTTDLDVRLLYQLSFIAEKQVFLDALQLNFVSQKKQIVEKEIINYKRKIDDMQINFSEPIQCIINKINAFNNRSQGAFFYYKQQKFRVFHGKKLTNPYIIHLSQSFNAQEVMHVYENCMIIKLNDGLIMLDQIEGDLKKLLPGDKISG